MMDGTGREQDRNAVGGHPLPEGEVGETSRGREHRLEFGAPARLRALRRGAFYRQGQLSQAALWLAAALGRV